MDNKLLIGIGAAVSVLGAGEIFSIWKVCKLSKEVKEFNNSVEDVAKNIDVEVPDNLVAVAMDRAANNAAETSANKVAKTTELAIRNAVEEAINKEKKNLEVSLKEELNRKISLVDIEDIKAKVVSKASLTVANSLVASLPVISSKSNTAEIIRACNDAGIDSAYDIERILEKSKEE